MRNRTVFKEGQVFSVLTNSLKKALTILILAGGGVLLGLSAQEAELNDRITVTPLLSLQRIVYDDTDYDTQNGYGPGIEISFDHFTKDYLASVGLCLSYEHFFYNNSDFHDFNDIKLSATIKRQLFPYRNPDAKTRFYTTMGAGADFVIRDDGDTGFYLLLNSGFQLSVSPQENMEIQFKLGGAITTQNGSDVLHAAAGIGLCFYLGAPEKTIETVQKTEQKAEQKTEQTEVLQHVHSITSQVKTFRLSPDKVCRVFICEVCGPVSEVEVLGK